MTATAALVLDKVNKTFGEVRAVDDLSAVVPAGTIFGFLGPNGAGKTTTLRMIMNVFAPDSGRIEVYGLPVGSRIGERVGYMPEERGLYKKMKVNALLRYFGRLKGLEARAAARETVRWLAEMGLAERAQSRVESLSRGMQQKLQFAVTVINDPDLLILDEPFSGLDPVNLDLIKSILTNARRRGKTVIFSTHMMHHAEQLCDALLLINRGRKILDGPVGEIRARYAPRAVEAELEGETDFIAALPIVERATRDDQRRWEILLREGADSQALLAELVGRVRVRLFQEKRASLHEIFVKLVGGDGQ